MDTKIRVGISQGDFNGIGIEVMLKTLADARINEMLTPVIYGSHKVLNYHKKLYDIPELNFNLARNADSLNHKLPNLINCYDRDVKIEPGRSSEAAGIVSYVSLESSVKDIKAGKIDVLVTAPVNKFNIQSQNFNFPGHTEYLAAQFNVDNTLMLMVCDKLKVGVVSGHIPVGRISNEISNIEKIYNKIALLNSSLIKDFNIRKPRIAVLGLNPHAGDKGVIGNEEINFIIPAIKKSIDKNILAYGPYPADGFFSSTNYLKFDGILAMYHDQGLIPFKILAAERGVNFTAGLPIVRTSPAHGTAYDIAGKNIASPDSFREAMYLACTIFNNRLMFDEINKNPLKTEKLKSAATDE